MALIPKSLYQLLRKPCVLHDLALLALLAQFPPFTRDLTHVPTTSPTASCFTTIRPFVSDFSGGHGLILLRVLISVSETDISFPSFVCLVRNFCKPGVLVSRPFFASIGYSFLRQILFFIDWP
jgi:hypothetical protein